LIAPAVWRAGETCDILIGPERLLKYFKDTGADIKVLKGNYKETLDWIVEHRNECSILVLVTGDPMIHSFGKMVTGRIEGCKIISGISSVQYALTKVGRSWEGVKIISLHGKYCPDLADQIRKFPDLAVLTDGEETARQVFNTISPIKLTGRSVYLCENLSLETESISLIHADEEIDISPLNLILILSEPACP
jgi:precorrin-6y C5,15-methyltransferase (decarboxylating) CbiE subunit